MTTAALSGTGAPAKAATKKARLWWLVHQWAGLKLSILMSFVLLTGTLAVFSAEMDWVMRPALRVAPASVSGPVDWTAIARNAAAFRPDYEIQSIDAPVASAFAASVMVKTPDGRYAFLYAHPTTGDIQGEGHWVGAKRVLRNMHRHLNMPTWLGVPIVSSLALLLLVTLLTSLLVYKKWWRGFARPIRARSARTGWGDFHRLAGVWSLWFIALMVFTGLWYLAESTVARAPPLPRPEAVGMLPAAPPPMAIADRLALGLATARATDPTLDIERVIFPSKGSAAFRFEGQKSAILVRPRANAVWTSAEDGRALLATDARHLSVHQRISEMADPLHFGTFGGYWTKIPWFLFGLLLTALSVSGAALHSMRLLKAGTVKGRWSEFAVTAWQRMGWWRWPSTALVLVGFVLIPTLFQVSAD